MHINQYSLLHYIGINSDCIALAALTNYKRLWFFKTQNRTKSMYLHFDPKLRYIYISISYIRTQLLVFL